jgi:two-component system, sensor histidine kinase and response regulator
MSDKPLSIFVVDDGKMARAILARQLSADGYEVTEAEDGEEALRLLEEKPCDGMVLDILMPGIDGMETLRRVREKHSRTELPVIMATAQDQIDNVVQAFDLGANDFVVKPVRFPILRSRLKTQLGYRKTMRELVNARDHFMSTVHARTAELSHANQLMAKQAASMGNLNEELQQFVDIICHDINEPLRMVTSYVDLLRVRLADQLDDETGVFMDYVGEGAVRMKQLLDDLNEFSRIKTRGAKFVKVDLNELVDEIEVLMAEEIETSGAVIERSSLATVTGDRSQLKRLLRELSTNAIRFRSKETPKITICCRDEGFLQCVSVRDNGIGFEEQHQEAIFAIFRRLHPREDYPGNGTGLAICRRIVERHAGTIRATPLAESGAEFTFTLPRTAGKAREAGAYL